MISQNSITIHDPTSIKLSSSRVIFAITMAVTSYFCGYYAPMLMDNSTRLILGQSSSSMLTQEPAVLGELARKKAHEFPKPRLHSGKKPPKSSYTNQCFENNGTLDAGGDASNSSWVWSRNHINVHLNIDSPLNENSNYYNLLDEKEDDDEDDDEGPFQPTGQHLLIDIQNVDIAFLRDAKRLAEALVQTTTQSGLTLLSYHCHDFFEPMGVSCAGVLLESHVALHTYPLAGIITLDLFTCGSQSLLPLVDMLQDLFAISSDTSQEDPIMHWSHRKRGYRDYFDEDGNIAEVDNSRKSIDANDVEDYLLGLPLIVDKKFVGEEQTKFQMVSIHETANLAESTRVPKSEKTHNKKVFLDGVLQSTLHGLEAYHEALVHPSLVSHPHPKRVAIIGGGEGATLREVLKHRTVETCSMIEIDAEFVGMSRRLLPEWNDCSDIIVAGTSGGSCFDDPRTELYLEDAIAWFLRRFGADVESVKEEEKYDVVIMDALDPSSAVGFSDILYGDVNFVSALARSLTKNGILVVQNGEVTDEKVVEPQELATLELLERFYNVFKSKGAVAVKFYSESHGQFLAPWDFSMIFMSDESRSYFYAPPPVVDAKLAWQTIATTSGSSPFRYFDGATMAVYQYPSRQDEFSQCLYQPELSQLCTQMRGFDPSIPNIPASSLELKQSLVPNAGRGVFFKGDFSKGSYLAIDDAVHSMKVMPFTSYLIKSAKKAVGGQWDTLYSYMVGYGFESEFYGDVSFHVDPGLATFANHGCNSTFNIGSNTGVDEHSADLYSMPPILLNDVVESAFLDPVADRNHFIHLVTTQLLRDVKEGEEVLDNYLGHSADGDWKTYLLDLRSQCRGQDVGEVTKYDNK